MYGLSVIVFWWIKWNWSLLIIVLSDGVQMSRWLLLTPFYALNPTQKAAMLAFICNELLCNKDVNAYVLSLCSDYFLCFILFFIVFHFCLLNVVLHV